MNIKGSEFLKNFWATGLMIGMLFICAGSTSQAADPPDQQIANGKELYNKGDFEHAVIAWKQAISLLDPEQHTELYLNTTAYMGRAYQLLGYHKKALAALHKALPYVEKTGNADCKVIFFSTLGDVCLSLAEKEQGLKYLMKGIEHARNIDNPRVLARILNNAGNVLAAEKDYDTATGVYAGCLDLIRESKEDAALRAKIMLNLARIEFEKGNNKEVAKTIPMLLAEIASLPDSFHKASDMITLSQLASAIQKKLARELKSDPEHHKNTASQSEIRELQPELAASAYMAMAEVRRIGEETRDSRVMSYANGYMGQLYETEGRYSEALNLTRRAIFFAQQGKFPQILYLWQWQTARLFEAQGHIEKAVEAYRNAIATLNPIRGELFNGFRQDFFKESVKPVYVGLAGLLLKQAASIQDDNARKKKLLEARDTMEMLKTAELEDFFRDECVVKSRKSTLDRTPPHTAVLYPIPLPDAIALLITLPDGIKHTMVPVDSERLEETVTLFRKQLQNRMNNRFMYSARELYDWLIRPVASDLKAWEVDTLIVAPGGVLRLIPFSAMNDGERFLVERYAIATVPAITLTDPKPQDGHHPDILLSGLSDSVQGAPPLPSVTKELKDIREIMDGDVLFENKDYTVENLTREFRNRAYDIVHLATHGVFGGTPSESFLLTYNGQLTMDALEQLIGMGRFREKQVDILTLSACQTALGNERAALGLAGVAVKAGVRSAVATLWYVDDEATSLAIRDFYRQLKKPGVSKAKALQNAQKNLIAQSRYWQPIYWAPFLLIGNWL